MQNHRYYQQPAACPYRPYGETMNHLFTCQSNDALQLRQTATKQLGKVLTAAHTPKPLTACILNGIQSWNTGQVIDCAFPTTADEVRQVTLEQTQIGWEHLLRGRISKRWQVAFLHFQPESDKKRDTKATTWARKLIAALWEYSFAIWEARNKTVHGQTEAAKESKALKELWRTTRQLYCSFETDPHVIPSNTNHLFDEPLLITQILPATTLRCWILSAQEAIAMQAYRDSIQQTRQKELLCRFLVPRHLPVTHRSPRRIRANEAPQKPATDSMPPEGIEAHLLAPVFNPHTATVARSAQVVQAQNQTPTHRHYQTSIEFTSDWHAGQIGFLTNSASLQRKK
jgi:hypothetical protein